MDPHVVLIFIVLAGAGAYYGGKGVAHVAKKTAHGIVHVVTLGKK